MRFLPEKEKNSQILVSSALVFVVCFICLNLFNQNSAKQNSESIMLPLVLNATKPYLITGNITRLKPDLEQLISGSSLERIDIHGADSTLLTSVRNSKLVSPSSAAAYEFSAPLVLDDALAATITITEHLSQNPTYLWANFLISFACALAAAFSGVVLNTFIQTFFSPTDEAGVSLNHSAVEGDKNKTNFPISSSPRGQQKLVLMIRLSDMRDQLLRTDDVDNYMDRIWRITSRMADTYGITLIGAQSGAMIFTVSAGNVAVALRHSIMFGWNLVHQENGGFSIPASLIAPIDFMGENPSHALVLSSNEDLLQLIERLNAMGNKEFCVCRSLERSLPSSVDAIPASNNNLRILSIEKRMLDLWKQQIQLQS